MKDKKETNSVKTLFAKRTQIVIPTQAGIQFLLLEALLRNEPKPTIFYTENKGRIKIKWKLQNEPKSQ
jgi:hypothetical protein